MMVKCKAEQRGTGASADERLVSAREEAGEKVVRGEMEQSPGDVGGGPPADAGSGPELLSHTMGMGVRVRSEAGDGNE